MTQKITILDINFTNYIQHAPKDKKLYWQKIENYRYQMEILGLKKNGKK